MSPNTSRLTTSQSGRVLTVTFDNPPRNFFDEQMSIELDDLTRQLTRDTSVGAVVFTGYDAIYMTHFDMTDLIRGARSSPVPLSYQPARVAAGGAQLACRSRTLDRLLRRTPARDPMLMARAYASMQRLTRMDKVVVTAINGVAFGMGAVFALACDIRLIADGSKIGLTESALNMLGAAGGTQRMVRMIGTSRAVELLLEGRWLTATDAAQIGLVHHVTDAARLNRDAHAIAERLARRSPIINREIKRMVYDAGSRPFMSATRMEAASLIATLTSPQAKRTMDHYLTRLTAHHPLTDGDVEDELRALGDSGVPGGPLRHPL